jgi:hypothetical protein
MLHSFVYLHKPVFERQASLMQSQVQVAVLPLWRKDPARMSKSRAAWISCANGTESMLKLVLNFALPAIAIILATLVQLALTSLWPGIQVVPSPVVSIDTYVVVFLALGLSFVAGGRAQLNVPTIAGAACAAIAPLAWLGLLLSSMVGVGSIAWLRPLVLFTIFMAMAPLIGVVLGWAASSLKRKSVPQAV